MDDQRERAGLALDQQGPLDRFLQHVRSYASPTVSAIDGEPAEHHHRDRVGQAMPVFTRHLGPDHAPERKRIVGEYLHARIGDDVRARGFTLVIERVRSKPFVKWILPAVEVIEPIHGSDRYGRTVG